MLGIYTLSFLDTPHELRCYLGHVELKLQLSASLTMVEAVATGRSQCVSISLERPGRPESMMSLV